MRKRRSIRKPLLITGIVLVLIATAVLFRAWYLPSLQHARLGGLDCGGSCGDRLWVHRTNTLERYALLRDKFKGFELDVMYVDSIRALQVFHPPISPGEQVPVLAQFLGQADSSHRFWLDIRDLDSNNVSNALNVLRAADPADLIRRNGIVELYDEIAASTLAAAGYCVSFNVWPGFAARMRSDSLFADHMRRLLKDVRYVSREAEAIPMLKELFPGKKIITWEPGLRHFIDRSSLRVLLRDSSVEVILVTIESRHYR